MAVRHHVRDTAVSNRPLSLSSLIEDALRDAVDPERTGFVERWRGSFGLADRDDARFRALMEKYG